MRSKSFGRTLGIIVISTLLNTPFSEARPNRFVIRLPLAAEKDYQDVLAKSGLMSFSEWVISQASEKPPSPSSLTKALELANTSPQESLVHFQAVIKELQSSLLNAASREMITSVYHRVSEMQVPEPTRKVYRQKIVDMISAHPELKSIFPGFTAVAPRSTSLVQKQNDIFWGQLHQLGDFTILVDGRKIENPRTWTPPAGEHQWALVSNSYEPLITVGTWSEFMSTALQPSRRHPLAEGDCQSTRLLIDDFQAQTQADIFAGKGCFTPAAGPLGPQTTARHLSPPEMATTSGSGRWVVPIVLFVGAGLAYSLKGKSISVRAPSFR